jgi:hypothetical protein
MTDTTDRTDCPAFELLATAYHEAGHAVAAVLVSPPLPLEEVTIIPRETDRGHASFEDWSDQVVPDGDEDDDEVGEQERRYLEADAVMTYLGSLAEAWLRTGNLTTPVRVGWSLDCQEVIAMGSLLCEDEAGTGPSGHAGYGRAWMGEMRSRATALSERHNYFWRAVGLVAGALMREKTLDCSEVVALVRAAQGQR